MKISTLGDVAACNDLAEAKEALAYWSSTGLYKGTAVDTGPEHRVAMVKALNRRIEALESDR